MYEDATCEYRVFVMVIWITGISGAGKSTVCETIIRMAKPHIAELVWLDGDVVREIFADQLGHSEAERVRQIKRIQRLAKELDSQGMMVLVAALYTHPDLLAWNRENFKGYAEIYLEASLDLVMQRDPKGLYSKVRAGEMSEVVGVDIPWNAPENPTLKIPMDSEISVEAAAGLVIDAVPELSSRI